ncbi:MAG: FAD/NAD(P)-binding oxidoreductase [Myxococcota bacterium]
MSHHEILIVGGGTAGISVASRIMESSSTSDVALVEPAEMHYYQPLWTLVGGGVFDREDSGRPMADVMPSGVDWYRNRVSGFEPASNQVELDDGRKLSYDILVVAAGIQLDWNKIEGLPESLGTNGVCSNYSYDTVPYTWELLKNFTGGEALFTFPSTPIKCAGAPQKIMYLAEETFRRNGVRSRTHVNYMCAAGAIFGIPKYRAALERIVSSRGIDAEFKKDLVAIRASEKVAVFKDMDTGATEERNFDMIHVTPPQSAPDFIKQSSLAGTTGWVEVDKHTLQHERFPNVFSLGDCSNLPCSKTGAAVRKQAPVLVENILAYRTGSAMSGHYDGYASCPLVTGYGRVILAEFGYEGKVMETFPFDQAQERYSMYALKAYGLPQMYWHGMLRGRL